MSRALLRSALELRTPVTRLPPTFLLPIRARFLHQTSQIVEPTAAADNFIINGDIRPPTTTQQTPPPAISASGVPASLASSFSVTTPPNTTPLSSASLDPSVRSLLPLLAAQPSKYITIHLHGKPYLVTPGDSIRLPFKMPGVVPGDVLRLNRATALGSRDFTLKGEPYVDERLYECRAVVLGTEPEPMRVMVKKKRRCRRKKQVFSKHKYTVLRISEVKIARLD